MPLETVWCFTTKGGNPMTKSVRFCFIFALFAMFAPAVHSQGQKQTTAQPAAREVSVDQVISFIKAKVSEDIIIAQIRKRGAFDPSPDQIVQLKQAGASDNIIRAMMDPQGQPVAASVAPPAVATSRPQSSAAVNPAAVPAAAPAMTPAVNDENNPLAQHDSGIYLYDEGRNGNTKLIPLERAAYQGTKTSNMLALRRSQKAILQGERAGIQTSERPVFYFYFEDRAAGLGKGLLGSYLTSPNQFSLVKLQVAKGHRETLLAEIGLLGGTKNTDDRAMVSFKTERIRTGIYKVTPNRDLVTGEYCFMASSGTGAQGSGAGGSVEIFDFSAGQ
jgi:hypothetical protein